MKRPSTIRLALMGGGAVLAIGTGTSLLLGDSAECRQARAAGLPDADLACRSGSGGSSSYSSRTGFFGGGSDSSSSSSSTASRGGFGGSAHAASASS